MAVVARTYGMRAAGKFDSGDYDHVDNTVSQVYRGVRSITPVSRRATSQTRGEVLTYDGALIEAVYFSSSGGHTANNEDVWNAEKPIPYLRGKDDPYDDVSPHHTWSASVDRSTLLQVLTQERGSLVKGFVIDSRSPDGRVETVKLLHSDGPNHRMKANTFRLVVNQGVEQAPLKSTWFDARRSGSRYIFDGHGFGHGVGLSQWGAHGMAQQGHSYREILRFYYTDVEIQRFGRVEKDPADAPVAKEPPARTDDATSRRIGW
jgi:stage II sporulation protein D